MWGESNWGGCVSTEHLDSAPPFTKWTKLTLIPQTLKSYDNAPLIKTTRSGLAGFLIILSSAERIILMSQTNWLLVPSVLATRFLRPKTVILSQAVMIQVVLSNMLSTKPGILDKRLWLRAHGSEGWDKDLWERTSTRHSTANYCGNNSPTSKLWLPTRVFSSLRHVLCHGKVMEIHSN